MSWNQEICSRRFSFHGAASDSFHLWSPRSSGRIQVSLLLIIAAPLCRVCAGRRFWSFIAQRSLFKLLKPWRPLMVNGWNVQHRRRGSSKCESSNTGSVGAGMSLCGGQRCDATCPFDPVCALTVCPVIKAERSSVEDFWKCADLQEILSTNRRLLLTNLKHFWNSFFHISTQSSSAFVLLLSCSHTEEKMKNSLVSLLKVSKHLSLKENHLLEKPASELLV